LHHLQYELDKVISRRHLPGTATQDTSNATVIISVIEYLVSSVIKISIY